MVEGKILRNSYLFKESDTVEFVYFIISGTVSYEKSFDMVVKPKTKYLKLLEGKV